MAATCSTSCGVRGRSRGSDGVDTASQQSIGLADRPTGRAQGGGDQPIQPDGRSTELRAWQIGRADRHARLDVPALVALDSVLRGEGGAEVRRFRHRMARAGGFQEAHDVLGQRAGVDRPFLADILLSADLA